MAWPVVGVTPGVVEKNTRYPVAPFTRDQSRPTVVLAGRALRTIASEATPLGSGVGAPLPAAELVVPASGARPVRPATPLAPAVGAGLPAGLVPSVPALPAMVGGSEARPPLFPA